MTNPKCVLFIFDRIASPIGKMIRKIVPLALIGLFWTGSPIGDAATPDIPQYELSRQAESAESLALNQSLARLQKRRFSLYNQGVLVESLDGGRILAEWNSDIPFNPASVIKLATSFWALSRRGSDYQFHTDIYGTAPIDQAKRALKGDLLLTSDGDPVFQTADALSLGRALLKKGIRQVEGDLVISGPFTMPVREGEITLSRAASALKRAFQKVGIRLGGEPVFRQLEPAYLATQTHFLTRRSPRLLDILWVQNAHSVNVIADRLGDALGGPEALRQFMLEGTRLDPPDFFVSKPSGLEHNRMTPRAAISMLRGLYVWLEEHQLRMQDIMPVAGLDEGTLANRFLQPSFRGGILGKTGTNPSKDGGISSLAGLAYTRDHGPVLYAIFNTHGSVSAYRRWQDQFLRDFIEENGGVGQFLSPKMDPVNVFAPADWLPSLYWDSLESDPSFSRNASARKSSKAFAGKARAKTTSSLSRAAKTSVHKSNASKTSAQKTSRKSAPSSKSTDA